MTIRWREITDREVPLHRAIISDILLWVLLVLLVSLGVYLFAIRIPEKRGQTIVLHLKDANEISKGSSMRMMGTEIGYVDDLRIQRDHVEITVQTYPTSLEIPSGSIFTILFTGLAGGKSIEVEIPAVPRPNINGKPVYQVLEPVRMKQALNSTIDVTQALQDGAENITDFFGKKKPVEELQFNIREGYQMTKDSIAYTDILKNEISQLQRDITDSATSAHGAFTDINHGAQKAVGKTQPQHLRPAITSLFHNVRNFENFLIDSSTGASKIPVMTGQLNQVNNSNSQLSAWLQKTQSRVAQWPIIQFMDRIEAGQAGFTGFLDWLDPISNQNSQAALCQVRQNIQRFNQQVIRLDQKISTKIVPANQSKTMQTQPAPVQPVVLVDRNGIPIQQTQPRWWTNNPAASKTPPPALTQASGLQTQKPDAFPVRLLKGVGTACRRIWDAICSLF